MCFALSSIFNRRATRCFHHHHQPPPPSPPHPPSPPPPPAPPPPPPIPYPRRSCTSCAVSPAHASRQIPPPARSAAARCPAHRNLKPRTSSNFVKTNPFASACRHCRCRRRRRREWRGGGGCSSTRGSCCEGRAENKGAISHLLLLLPLPLLPPPMLMLMLRLMLAMVIYVDSDAKLNNKN
jgi:hypothetical protein